MLKTSPGATTITKTGSCGAGLKLLAQQRTWLLGLGLLLSGCRDAAIIQKEDVKSPDGHWTARMEIEQFGGPGTAGLQTHVYLVRTNTRNEPIEILSLSDETVSTAQVQIHWQDNRHLDISRFPDSEIEFQAIKCAGIEIAVH
jgi:hypothetical protein